MIGISIVFISIVYLCLLYLKKKIQCYYFDNKCSAHPDLNGYYAVVTGGNSGIGYGTAIGLAKLGANVIIACRSMEKGQKAVDKIKKKSGSQKVSLMKLDLSNLSSVQEFISEYKLKNIPLNILVNNAGIVPLSPELTADGYELSWQTNYLSSFFLTNELLPLLKESGKGKTNGSRIVFVSSGAHTKASIHWEDVNLKNNFKKMKNYGQSKLAQIMYSKELARREKDVITSACTPGFVRTNILSGHLNSKLQMLIIILYPVYCFIGRSVEMGAQTVLHCALSHEVNSGAYYSNCYEKPAEGKDGIANNEEASKRLWELSQKMIDEGLTLKKTN